MYIAHKDSADRIDNGYGEYIYKLANSVAGGLNKHSVVYVEIAPGMSNKKHYHPKVEETYYILSGQAWIILNDEESMVYPGQLITIPTGMTHKIINPSKDTMLCFIATCAEPWTEDCSIFVE